MALAYINENRLNNVLSKEDDITDVDYKMVWTLAVKLMKDAWEDLTIDHPEILEIKTKRLKMIKKSVTAKAKYIVESCFEVC